MPKIQYVNIKIGSERRELIDKANEIIEEYRAQGFELTLRQLFYQFVSRDIIANSQREYKNLGDVINDARLAGLVDWEAIVDRTRNLQSVSHWDDPSDIIAACAQSYRIDKWADQPYRPEVWIEKDALVGVIETVCTGNDVPYFSCRGYTSQSEMWAAGRRLRRYRTYGQEPIILHLGDHDPSGKDMTRDIEDRLEMFAEGKIEVRRLALNFDQIRQYNPPPNPCKVTDSRADGYIAEFGRESWELDALEPSVIADLIQREINKILDTDEWNKLERRETQERNKLKKLSEKWDTIKGQIR